MHVLYVYTYMYLVDVRDQFSLRRVPGFLLAGSQFGLNVEQLLLQIAPFRVPEI